MGLGGGNSKMRFRTLIEQLLLLYAEKDLNHGTIDGIRNCKGDVGQGQCRKCIAREKIRRIAEILK